MSEQTYDDARINRVRVGHLVVGLVFLGLALSWALRAGGVIDGTGTGVVLPVVLVAAGVAGLVASVAGSRHRRTDQQSSEPMNDDTKEIER